MKLKKYMGHSRNFNKTGNCSLNIRILHNVHTLGKLKLILLVPNTQSGFFFFKYPTTPFICPDPELIEGKKT